MNIERQENNRPGALRRQKLAEKLQGLFLQL
jgi:hypothetical protein